eukprot:TRINITY_DN22798_c0_g1_i1.p1 TRINITY_DN22798_c0_g1~~TRINITY_DN22798_c0_g1_i1.p1  ORF type:complete len:898 (-),score=274.92 TRINITY_DN22798_c0_g1_i1:246-2939(-)
MTSGPNEPPPMLRPGLMRPEDFDDPPPFAGVDKATVVQETKMFGNVSVNPRDALAVIVRLLYVIYCCEPLTVKEAEDVFFNTTKLFQIEHPTLRRIVHIVIKELSPQVAEGFIIANTLIKHMNSDNNIDKANAIRCLRKISESSMLTPIERYLKQAIVDKSHQVATAALITGVHISVQQPELVRRWAQEVNEAVRKRPFQGQYHAILLISRMRRLDAMSAGKLIQQTLESPFRWALAMCVLIRLVTNVLVEEDLVGEALNDSPLFQFLTKSIRNTADPVIFETARAMLRLQLAPAHVAEMVSALRYFVTSARPLVKFAAVRILSDIATHYPSAVAESRQELEMMFGESNRYIATVAIATLLKIGPDVSLERLLKRIATFVSDIQDEFRVVVIDALRVFALRHPQKYFPVLLFLAEALREEGGFEYKRALVEAIVDFVEHVPAAMEDGLAHLCEFIEDCEYNALAHRIVHLVGRLAPHTAQPHKYIRYVYNRTILEAPSVRASAVSALARVAASCEPLRASISVLLRRSLLDHDDEVRDRAALSLKCLAAGGDALQRFIDDPATEVGLALSAIRDRADQQSGVASVTGSPTTTTAGGAVGGAAAAGGSPSDAGGALVGSAVRSYVTEMKKVADVAALLDGPLPFKSTDPVLVTDAESEYLVHAVKHMTATHVIVQLRAQNTTREHVFEELVVSADASGWQDADGTEPTVVLQRQVEKLRPGATESMYLVYEREVNTYPTGVLALTLDFKCKDVDPDTDDADPSDEGVEASYPLEDLSMDFCDYMRADTRATSSDQHVGAGAEGLTDEYVLEAFSSIPEGTSSLVSFSGMAAVRKGDQVPQGASTHTFSLAGTLLASPQPAPMWAEARLYFSQEKLSLQWQLLGGSAAQRDLLVGELFS